MSVFKAFFGLGKIPKVIKFFEFQSFDDVNKTAGAIAAIKEQIRERGLQLTNAQKIFLDDQQKQIEMVFEKISKPSDTGIKNAESAKIFNLQGEKLDPSKPIVGGSQSGKKINREFFERDAEAKEVQKRIESGVATTVEKMLAMKPIDAMKEANLVIGRKGQYKNLSQEDAKKILQDTEDHIFEKNVDKDPEDMFADGGRIGFRIGSDSGKDVSGREYGAPSAAAQSVSTSPSRDNGFSGGNNLTDTTTKQVLEDAGKTAVKNVLTNKAMEKLGLGGIFGMAPQVAALLGIINSVRNSQTNEENMFANGGRIGFKKGMDRRTFMKYMAGLASLPVVGKLFKGAKVASKVAPVAEKAVGASSGQPPAYFFNLVKKIKNLGDDVSKREAMNEREVVTRYKDYELTENLTTGEKTIQRIKVDGDNPTRYDEVLAEETYMSYKPGKGQTDEATGGKVADEYTEDTSYIDKKGTVYDTVEGVSDDVVKEGTVFEDNITDFETKKADGGRIGLFAGSLKGGGILRTIIKNLAKEKGVSPSEYLRVANYKALPDSAKRFMSEAEFLKLKEAMTGKRIEMVENVRDMIQSRLAFDKSKADLAASMNKASPGYGDQAVKMMFPEGSFKSPVPAGAGEKDIMMMEQLIKNLKLKGRKENASGGIARMLGE